MKFYNNLYTGINNAGGAMLAQIAGVGFHLKPHG